MGAKMMPMEKKRGRTVFGVRIGLVRGQRCVCAVGGPLMLDDLLPCLQPLLSERGVCGLIQPSATCPGSYAYHLNLPSCPSRMSRECSIIPRGRVWVDWYRNCRG